MNDKLTILNVVLNILCALILIGVAIYYIVTGEYYKSVVFGIVGIIFIILPVRTLIKYFISKRNDDGEDKK